MGLSDIRDAAERGAVDDEPEPEPEPEREPDEPEPDEPAPEPAPEPEPAPSDRDMEAVYKAVETKAANYGRSQLAKLAETEAPWQPCPCCQVPGFVLPFNPSDPDEYARQAAVEAYFGAGEPDYVDAPDAEPCDACNALGETRTRSKVPMHKLKVCLKCNGVGWVTVALPDRYASAPNQNGNELAGVAVGTTAGQPPDVWGRPFGSKYYDVPPGMET